VRTDHPIVTNSEAETEALAAYLALALRPGDVVGLYGELGAGKTAFVRGVVRGLGADPRQVRSPTFTVLNIYAASRPVYHFDLYRLPAGADLEAIGFYEFSRGEGVSLIEWADRVTNHEEVVDLRVRIEFGALPDQRSVWIEGPQSARFLEMLERSESWRCPVGS